MYNIHSSYDVLHKPAPQFIIMKIGPNSSVKSLPFSTSATISITIINLQINFRPFIITTSKLFKKMWSICPTLYIIPTDIVMVFINYYISRQIKVVVWITVWSIFVDLQLIDSLATHRKCLQCAFRQNIQQIVELWCEFHLRILHDNTSQWVFFHLFTSHAQV